MSTQPRVSNSMYRCRRTEYRCRRTEYRCRRTEYRCRRTEVEAFISLAELALDMPRPLPMALIGQRTK